MEAAASLGKSALQQLKPEEVEVDIIRAEVTQEPQGNGVEESELDEMWSYVVNLAAKLNFFGWKLRQATTRALFSR